MYFIQPGWPIQFKKGRKQFAALFFYDKYIDRYREKEKKE
jgi:hypothetical protein